MLHNVRLALPEDDMAEMISATLLSTPQEIEYLLRRQVSLTATQTQR